MNITDVIWRNSFAWPDRDAVVWNGKSVSYGQLRRLAEKIAGRLHRAGVERGFCVGISVDNALLTLGTALALARLGATSTLVDKRHPASRKEEWVNLLGVRALIQDAAETWRSTKKQDLIYLGGNDLYAPATRGGEHLAPVASDADDLHWIVGRSSGTTGTPKSIPQTHRQGHTRSMSARSEEKTIPRLLLALGLGTNIWMNHTMRQLYSGGCVILMRAVSVEHFLEHAKRDRPDQVLIATGTAVNLIDRIEQSLTGESTPFPSIQTVTLTGSAVPPALRARIVKSICPNLQVFYGASETGGVALLSASDTGMPESCVGRLYPWSEVRVVNDAGEVLAPGETGRLQFRTPGMISGYLNDEDATRKAFVDGWFSPGDVGSVDAAGYVMLRGRSDHVLNIGGNKVDPAAVERVVDSCPGVLESAVTKLTTDGGHDVLVAIVVPQDTLTKEMEERVKERCREQLRPFEVPRAVVAVKRLPKNAGGKTRRDELAAMLQVSPGDRADAKGPV
jgi:long-chain acyl-CoA synthetase